MATDGLEDVRRAPGGRGRGYRIKTFSIKRTAKRDLAAGARAFPEPVTDRPATYAECERRGLGTPGRPCPYVACKHHLYLDVDERTGAVRLNFPDREVDEIPATCVRRVVARHPDGLTLEQVAVALNVTREAIRQTERRIYSKVVASPEGAALERPEAPALHWTEAADPPGNIGECRTRGKHYSRLLAEDWP